MSFSDLMQSGRGPGVIGMLLALVVVAGFGVLFILAFNEEPPGEKISIQSVINDQAREIADLTGTIAREQKNLEVIPKRQADELKLRDAKREILYAGGRIDSTRQGLAATRKQLDDNAVEFEKYKDQYREFARLGAKGEQLAKLQIRGKTYDNVIIKEVTAIGMQISHQGGFARIPYEDLPAELQDRFQFDPNQKAAAIAKENSALKQHETNVDDTLNDTRKQATEREQKEQQERQVEANKEIAVKTARINELDGELSRLQQDLQLELQKKLRNTQRITSQIADKQQERAKLQARISELRARP